MVLAKSNKDIWDFEEIDLEIAKMLDIPTQDDFFNMDDESCRNTQQMGRDSDDQRKRTLLATKSWEKIATNRAAIVQAVHGLLRHGLKEMMVERKEYAKTAEALAKFKADSEVLVTDTKNAIALTEHEKNARITLANTQTQNDRQRIDHQYSSLADLSLHKLGQAKERISTQISSRKQETLKPAWVLE